MVGSHERARDVHRMLRAAAQVHETLLCARIAKHTSITPLQLISVYRPPRCRPPRCAAQVR
eukprot:5781984-Pleurochrysis_carterae.AAC.1